MTYEEAVRVACERYSKTTQKQIKYGTAGFRSRAEELDYIMYRMGLLAALRSRDTAAAIGVMITASHNPLPDNGVKLVDPMGEMLAPAWEAHATNLVNTSDQGVGAALQAIVQAARINVTNKALVFIGRDTRPTSEGLRDAVVAGVRAAGGEVKDFGVVSTPIIHYLVTCHNDDGKYGEASVEGYYKKIGSAFTRLRPEPRSGQYEPTIMYDGANGVGALAMEAFLAVMGGSLTTTMYNRGEGVLNHLCGADYVKVQQKWPEGVPRKNNVRCVSVDGDADRIIYSFLDDAGTFYMLDGDKIATLVAGYLQELVKKTGLNLRLGLVQTAYANGASTAYITEKLGVPVACAKTGVKHLHHMALQFDIGVYFEANGHGTVIFSSKAREAINAAAEANNKAAERLSQVMDVINETVGDAISDMLLVETVLHARGWSITDWHHTYTDLPNRQMKVTVGDRAVITTTDAERVCETPSSLQDTINKLVAGYTKGRAFVRPSGTEDVVRVYAEAATQQESDALAVAVAQAVHDQAGGTGDRPTTAT